ncbi:hypothetical protein TNCV_2251491 [Trichonephila clavipes]|nr:hypothetical protein TNCV_2251491 [Trichonephila clavipes]
MSSSLPIPMTAALVVEFDPDSQNQFSSSFIRKIHPLNNENNDDFIPAVNKKTRTNRPKPPLDFSTAEKHTTIFRE